MFKNRMTFSLSAAAAMVPILFYMYIYRQMPDFVPVHYDGAVADRFALKGSYEVILISLLGWLGFGIIKLLQLLLRRLFLHSYVENLAVIHRVWNAATLLVTAGFSVLAIYALLAMV
ncbi:hypothetical protein [Paenibacillus sp. FSL R7-0331]|uniref:hypothetical protein n=1 Tax=Paenibacillus sp. FSL R7-0331 TaxID=1536773 RepID=UPI0004F662A7|nr:hypothetical protein [Paenibacillus sp. FSL R7-0331]AIQ50801.1 hypothetical protein R70331_04175 [Paenibacillus sp. FSL R7-0331]